MALVVVLGFIAVMALLGAHLTVSSEVVAREAKVAAERGRLRYVAESAVGRSFWLYSVDRRDYRSRRLDTSPEEETFDGAERWLADSRPHALRFDRAVAEASVWDADRGIDISGGHPDRAVRATLLGGDVDLDFQEAVNAFLDVLMDYVDRGDGDLTRLYGKERADYEAEAQPRMPRNGPLQLRDEVIWIDGLQDILTAPGDDPRALLESFRMVPPAGRQFDRNRKPAFFSASPTLVAHLADLTDAEMELVLEAQADWSEGAGSFSDYVDPDLWARLQPHFSFDESGVAIFQVTAATADGAITRSLRVTRDCRRFPSGNPKTIENWERVWP